MATNLTDRTKEQTTKAEEDYLQPFVSPGHNQIWKYDDVTHICKVAPTPRNTREGQFLALCCA